MKFVELTLLVMLVSPLTGCASVKPSGNLKAFCQGSQITLDDHINAMITYGPQIISAGAGEVLVTGDQLVTIYDKACDNG